MHSLPVNHLGHVHGLLGLLRVVGSIGDNVDDQAVVGQGEVGLHLGVVQH